MEDNQQAVSRAFSYQSPAFDKLDSDNKLTGHLRSIYRGEIMKHARPASRILELNCGTGIDSLYFGKQGHHLLSIDIAPGMIDILNEKINKENLSGKVTAMQCSYEQLYKLSDQRFDYIISNFGGLNCTATLDEVLGQFKGHLNEGGKVSLVIMPKISPWELLMMIKGKFATAFRRLNKGTKAHIEGVYFSVFYYNPSYVIRHLKEEFELVSLRGIYFAVPPEFYQRFVERYPRTYRLLQQVEKILGRHFPFNRWCDHYLITFQKRAG